MYYKRKDSYRWCGTSNVLRYDLDCLLKSLTYDAIEASDYTNLDLLEEFLSLYSCFIKHRVVAQSRAEKETPIEPLPFPGAVYVLDGKHSL